MPGCHVTAIWICCTLRAKSTGRKFPGLEKKWILLLLKYNFSSLNKLNHHHVSGNLMLLRQNFCSKSIVLELRIQRIPTFSSPEIVIPVTMFTTCSLRGNPGYHETGCTIWHLIFRDHMNPQISMCRDLQYICVKKDGA